jgi:methane/ammonia monooxygenase subunit C
LHYGFVIFGWLALAVMGTLTQTFYSFTKLIKHDLCPDLH